MDDLGRDVLLIGALGVGLYFLFKKLELGVGKTVEKVVERYETNTTNNVKDSVTTKYKDESTLAWKGSDDAPGTYWKLPGGETTYKVSDSDIPKLVPFTRDTIVTLGKYEQAKEISSKQGLLGRAWTGAKFGGSTWWKYNPMIAFPVIVGKGYAHLGYDTYRILKGE